MEETKKPNDKSKTRDPEKLDKVSENIPPHPVVDPSCEGKVNYHGPPNSYSTNVTKEPKGSEADELKRKDEQIYRLLAEVQTYAGKIKGYQTLGHLYQEARQECAHYKQKNEELANKLEVVMKRLLPEKDAFPGVAMVTSRNENRSLFSASAVGGDHLFSRTLLERLEAPNDSEPLYETSYKGGNHEEKSQGNKELVGNSSTCLQESKDAPLDAAGNDKRQSVDLESTLATESEVLSIGEHDRRSKSPGESSTVSSPSFVCIRGSGLSSAAQTPLSDSLQEGETTHGILNRPTFDSDHAAGDKTHDDRLNDANIPSELRAMAEDLQRAGIRRAKIEKQARVQQVLLSELQTARDSLVLQLQAKQKECEDLQENYSQALEKLRQYGQEKEFSFVNSASNGESLASTEWVEVEKQKDGKDPLRAEIVRSYSMTEMQLRNQIQQLQTRVGDLEIINQKLDEGIRHSEQTNFSLYMETKRLRERLTNNQQNDEKRQQDFDAKLLALKKQREELEMEKEEALDQLMLERNLRADKEAQCQQQITVLENKIWQLERQASLKQVEVVSVNYPAISSPSSASSEEKQRMLTDVALLQQQVTIYKEDFDHERKDRVKAQAHLEDIKLRLNDANKEIDSYRRQISRLNEELRTAKSESSRLMLKFNQAMDELKGVKTHLKPAPSAVQPNYQRHVSESKWTCRSCTYENLAVRSSCEMCGSIRQSVATSKMPLQESVCEFTGRGASVPMKSGNYFQPLEEDNDPHRTSY